MPRDSIQIDIQNAKAVLCKLYAGSDLYMFLGSEWLATNPRSKAPITSIQYIHYLRFSGVGARYK